MIEQFFLQHVEGTKPASKYVKVSKYGFTCDSCFPIFGPHTEIYSVNKKMAGIAPHLNTFHAVKFLANQAFKLFLYDGIQYIQFISSNMEQKIS